MVGCVTSTVAAEKIVSVSKSLDLASKAWILLKSAGEDGFIKALGDDSLFVVGPTQWEQNLRYKNALLPPLLGDTQNFTK